MAPPVMTIVSPWHGHYQLRSVQLVPSLVLESVLVPTCHKHSHDFERTDHTQVPQRLQTRLLARSTEATGSVAKRTGRTPPPHHRVVGHVLVSPHQLGGPQVVACLQHLGAENRRPFSASQSRGVCRGAHRRTTKSSRWSFRSQIGF